MGFGISNYMMTINQAPLHRKLSISVLENKKAETISDLESRLMHLGFIDGAEIEVKLKAPLFQEPLLVEVRGRLVALTKAEAQMVHVEIKL
jgi:Fe2+ transport system protein FeoA